ncbi:flagellar protein FlgJ [Parasphingorhabdus marina DSM 22363]|uniref:Flagellar protein FlgJ n=1 Tax=Parasphingorhabdus marina DSM 22363 TaxID=1123272 RepID=A0A1N6CW80_9SPHN|nr:rod-binding protein [Parasphingorhabdus marina]SIN62739.1 flagellar protein FlgJ [Parasphingorhabdus marina DSM 22363]
MTNIPGPAAQMAASHASLTPARPPLDPSAGATADKAAQAEEKAELKAALQAFEAIFARQLVSTMRAGSLGDDLFGSAAGDQFRDMADSRLADDMASKGALGLADMMLKQFGYDDE